MMTFRVLLDAQVSTSDIKRDPKEPVILRELSIPWKSHHHQITIYPFGFQTPSKREVSKRDPRNMPSKTP